MTTRYSRYALLIIVAVLLAVIGLCTSFIIVTTQRAAREAADNMVRNAASVVEGTINRLFLQIDGTLLSLPSLMSDLARLQQLDADSASRVLRNTSFQNLNFRDLILVNADGIAWASAQPASRGRPVPVNVSKMQSIVRSGSVSISEPVKNPITGEWALFFSRPVRLPGTSAAYAVAEVPVPLILTLLAPAAEVEGFRVVVERESGQILAALPHDESRIGQRLDPPAAKLQDSVSTGSTPSRFGGPDTITIVRPTLYRTTYISVSFDLPVALQKWAMDRNRLIAVAAGAAILVITLGGTLWFLMNQRDRIENERVRARTTLESAINSMSDGFVMFDVEDRLVISNAKYRELYPLSVDVIVPGNTFTNIIQTGFLRGQYPDAGDSIEAFTAQTLRWHRGNEPPIERKLNGERWILSTERSMPDGGTVGIRTDITPLKATMRDLAASERRFSALAKAGAVVTWQAAADGRILEAVGWDTLTGQPSEALTDGRWLTAIHPDDQPAISPNWVTVSKRANGADIEFRLRTHGEWRWVRIRGVPVFEEGHLEPTEWVGTVHDNHDYRMAQISLAESEARFVRATTAVGLGTWDWDVLTDNLQLSPGYEALFGRSSGSLATAKAALRMVLPEDRLLFTKALRKVFFKQGVNSFDIEYRIVKEGPEPCWLRTQGRAERNGEGPPFRLTGVTQDITAKRLVEARIAHMARHDALTDLPNRLTLREKLEEAVTRMGRGEPFAVFCLDLDRFKQVNDTLGHPAGDQLLCDVTKRLLGCIRKTDTVARLGGDEFAIVQSSVNQPEDSIALAARIISEVSRPYDIEGQKVVIGASVGIAIAPHDGDEADQLLRNADLALYRSKSEGRGRYRFFEAEMNAIMQARHALENDLRKALAENQFEIFYQPFIEVKSGEISGFEALLRWLHPVRGMVPPDAFIALAEELGLISAIGDFVLMHACAEATRWPPHIKLALNLSPLQIANSDIYLSVMKALRTSGLAPSRLELEITETVLLQDNVKTMEVLEEFQKIGIKIAMDDFGTGYSSLSYLCKFPFNKVKIDKSFIAHLDDDGPNSAIVYGILKLCASLGVETTAEGVETEEQLALLTAAGCTTVQGFLFSKAKPATEVLALIQMRLGAGCLNAGVAA
ncbi:EAL domain-containing protein [Pseudomonas sp.]|uniref:EAL domain-containing protein n=1 Tax=Pseudomonas sp. TaxID=306 RepID=UPI0025CC0152|nr:EAL domain-containing protein [Pseudomonas sp.]